MVRGNAKDLVLPPADSDEFIFLARRVGYTTDDDGQKEGQVLQSNINTFRGARRPLYVCSSRLASFRRITFLRWSWM